MQLESSPSPGMTREEGVATCKKVGWAAKLNPFTKKAGFLCEGTVNVIKNKQESDRALIDSLGQ